MDKFDYTCALLLGASVLCIVGMVVSNAFKGYLSEIEQLSTGEKNMRKDTDGNPIKVCSHDDGTKVFYRGNNCPLCGLQLEVERLNESMEEDYEKIEQA